MGYSNSVRMLFNILVLVEERSHCARSAVGAILTDREYERIIAYGYNGNYRGGPNSCDRSDVGNCGCIHAEANALVKPRTETPYAIFTSLTPCINCAKLIVQAGIREVFSLRPYRNSQPSLELFDSVGIVHHYRSEGDHLESSP